MTTPEEKARQQIDKLISSAGWTIQDLSEIKLGASAGIAVREFPVESGTSDYLLFVDRKAVGVIEAKPEGTTLSGVAEQTDGYITSIPPNLPHVQEPLPFSYETTGVETYFRDIRDPDTRSRRVFAFHKPETLKSWMLAHDTLRARLMGMADMNELAPEGLRLCQFEAIHNLEQSFARARPKALIQMATGTGKT